MNAPGEPRTAAQLKLDARRILDGDALPGVDPVVLSGQLRDNKDFELARRLLERERRSEVPGSERDLLLREKQAVCTYKDPECGAEESLERALRILRGPDDIDLLESRSQETLGVAGSIYKRMWEVDGRAEHLQHSLNHYRAAWRLPSDNNWYGGINAAYVLDLLADSDGDEAARSGREQEAADIRQQIVDRLEAELAVETEPDWWRTATLVEAHFGLGRYDRAVALLRREDIDQQRDWVLESTVRQLASLAGIGRGRDSAGRSPGSVDVIEALVGGDASHILTAFGGRFGLALSGGGFRAAFYHLGVLARLAEVDALRHVEVLSCVSGGSIAGAQYYLRLHRLLSTVADAVIAPDDYVRIVRAVQEDMVLAVRARIRSRALFSPRRLVGWLRPSADKPGYRVAELLDEHLLSRAYGSKGCRMLDLVVQPPGGPSEFNPKRHNWRRSAKVPVLVVNATTLNTGHNWQFTATWMGEPASAIEGEVDAIRTLTRMWLADEAPPDHRDIALSTAVAASACVPGAFPPVVLDKLYRDVRVNLVDGGLHDNQGVYGLLDQDCRFLLVSDASATKDVMDKKVWNPWNALFRSTAVTMGVVRKEFYRELDGRQRSSRLRRLWYLHLAKGLEGPPLPIYTSPVARRRAAVAPASPDAGMTSYGVPKKVQRRLASLRTDLDVFTDDEADALMLSGYLASEACLKASPHPLVTGRDVRADWRFRRLEPLMRPSPPRRKYRKLLRTLDAGRHRWFRRAYRVLGSRMGDGA